MKEYTTHCRTSIVLCCRSFTFLQSFCKKKSLGTKERKQKGYSAG